MRAALAEKSLLAYCTINTDYLPTRDHTVYRGELDWGRYSYKDLDGTTERAVHTPDMGPQHAPRFSRFLLGQIQSWGFIHEQAPLMNPVSG